MQLNLTLILKTNLLFNTKTKVLVLGAGGFIGTNLIKKLKSMDCHITAVDLKYPQFSDHLADEYYIKDLRKSTEIDLIFNKNYDFIFQLAADMGGAEYIFSGKNDADVMYNSSLINLNILNAVIKNNFKGVLFYASSACIYPEHNQMNPENPNCEESSAYPANPDSEYGWEKLYAERLYASFKRNYKLSIRIARFHNIYGPEGIFEGGREKAPAAICKKVITANDGEHIEIWGDGKQTRSFLYIDDCINALIKLVQSNYDNPINIGSEEMISINDLAKMIIKISGKNLKIKNIEGFQGVRGRNSHNAIIEKELNWQPQIELEEGMKRTYDWIKGKIDIN